MTRLALYRYRHNTQDGPHQIGEITGQRRRPLAALITHSAVSWDLDWDANGGFLRRDRTAIYLLTSTPRRTLEDLRGNNLLGAQARGDWTKRYRAGSNGDALLWRSLIESVGYQRYLYNSARWRFPFGLQTRETVFGRQPKTTLGDPYCLNSELRSEEGVRHCWVLVTRYKLRPSPYGSWSFPLTTGIH